MSEYSEFWYKVRIDALLKCWGWFDTFISHFYTSAYVHTWHVVGILTLLQDQFLYITAHCLETVGL